MWISEGAERDTKMHIAGKYIASFLARKLLSISDGSQIEVPEIRFSGTNLILESDTKID